MIIQLKYNIQNICAAFIITRDNIEYFQPNEPVKFIIFRSHNKDTQVKLNYHTPSLLELLMSSNDLNFKTLKSSSSYRIEVVDFVHLLRNTNIDIEHVANDNQRLLDELTNYLLKNAQFEYSSMTHTYGENTDYIIDCSRANSIISVTRYVHNDFLDQLPNRDMEQKGKIKYVDLLQSANIALIIFIHVLFVIIFVLYLKRILIK